MGGTALFVVAQEIEPDEHDKVRLWRLFPEEHLIFCRCRLLGLSKDLERLLLEKAGGLLVEEGDWRPDGSIAELLADRNVVRAKE